MTSEITQLKKEDSISNTDEAESLLTNATNVDQSSYGHLHTPPSQDISKLIAYALSEEKKKEKQWLNLTAHNLEESQESDPCKKESDIEETMELFQNT